MATVREVVEETHTNTYNSREEDLKEHIHLEEHSLLGLEIVKDMIFFKGEAIIHLFL